VPASSEDEYLTVAEIAELLKVNQQTVRNWIADGALAAVRVGPRRVRVRRTDLDAYLTAGAPAARRDPRSTAGDAQATLRAALDRTLKALDGESESELALALGDLRSATGRLSRLLNRKND